VDSLHPKIFNNKLFEEGDIIGSIQKGFQEMDQYLVEEANKENAMHGCTCVCSLVLDDVVYFANIGDSEGILISVENGVVIPKNMTKAHKANDPSEKERIESLGGHVFFGRLYGSLAVSRSFGDALYKRPKTSKDFVSWEPYTITDTLTPNHKYMVLACDGLFDVMNHQEVADFTHKLFSEGQDAASVAKSLVLKAINDLATEDNVTVIIVKIEWDDGQQKHHEENNPATVDPATVNPAPVHTSPPTTEASPSEPPAAQHHHHHHHHVVPTDPSNTQEEKEKEITPPPTTTVTATPPTTAATPPTTAATPPTVDPNCSDANKV